MRSRTAKHSTWLLALIALMLLILPTAAANQETEYQLDWWTVDNGGATLATEGDYRLSGTIGQAEAGTLTTESYRLLGGFWSGVFEYAVFLPLVLR